VVEFHGTQSGSFSLIKGGEWFSLTAIQLRFPTALFCGWCFAVWEYNLGSWLFDMQIRSVGDAENFLKSLI